MSRFDASFTRILRDLHRWNEWASSPAGRAQLAADEAARRAEHAARMEAMRAEAAERRAAYDANPVNVLSGEEQNELRQTIRGEQLLARLAGGEDVLAEIVDFIAARRELLR